MLILLEREGVDVDRTLGKTGAIASAARLVRFDAMRELVLALPPTARQGFGLALGDLAPLTAHGPVAAAMAASATLGEALETLADFGGARARAVRFRYAAEPDFGDVMVVEAFDFGDLRDVVLESTALHVCKMMAAVVGRTPAGLVFEFPYAAPPWAERYADYLPGAIRFDAPALRIRTPRAHLSMASVAPDARVRESALRECEREASEIGLASERELAPLIRARLAEAAQDYPGMEVMAASLGVSPRTLIRRLKEKGLRYRQLVDEARAELACWRLAHTADTVDQIAADLGYLDTSNFSRTFRRWRKQTPSEFRRRAGR